LWQGSFRYFTIVATHSGLTQGELILSHVGIWECHISHIQLPHSSIRFYFCFKFFSILTYYFYTLNTSMIRSAIENKELIEFIYRGHVRISEPHVYGMKGGKRQILVYQIGGLTSSGKLPDWRRINLDEISGLKVIKGQNFAGYREYHATDHNEWDTIIASVK